MGILPLPYRVIGETMHLPEATRSLRDCSFAKLSYIRQKEKVVGMKKSGNIYCMSRIAVLYRQSCFFDTLFVR